jgi:glycosyltransferase involved in cell wall biosynthesis
VFGFPVTNFKSPLDAMTFTRDSRSTGSKSQDTLADVTFIILTHNEEQRLPDCLASLEAVAQNIFVVDSFSTDGTVSLLQTRSLTFSQRPFKDYGEQRRWAQQNNPFATHWVFHLDADERLTEPLRQWLIEEFPMASTQVEGFLFSRRTIFMGRWIRWGGHYPTYHLRLFRSNLGRCEDKAYDQHFVVDGRVAALPGRDIIDTVTTDLTSFIRSHDKWATNEAMDYLGVARPGEVRAQLSTNPVERRRWAKRNLYERGPLFIRAFLYFVYRYFLRLGFLDGREGAIFHVLQGFWFRFLVDAKIFEQRRRRGLGK